MPSPELLNPVNFSVDPTVAGTGTVVDNDVTTFLKEFRRRRRRHRL